MLAIYIMTSKLSFYYCCCTVFEAPALSLEYVVRGWMCSGPNVVL